MRLIDADALNEKLCKTTIFIKDGEVFQRMINDAPTVSAEATRNMKAWNGLYIKVYDDDDPQDKAEKLYQICDSNEALAEVAKCIQEYLDEPSAKAEQVTGKLNKRDNSLLTDDSDECKEQKSKLDLISRQAAIELIKNSYYNLAENMDDVWAMVHDVEQLPSAPDSRQRGEWVYGIDDETGEKDCYAWTCSVCNKKYPWQPNYCPNCGARMYKGGEDE